MVFRLRALFACFLLISSLSAAAESDFCDLLKQDAQDIFGAPAHWGKQDWQDVSIATAAVFGTALVIDRPLRDFMRKQDQGSRFWLEVEKFGREYAALTMVGLYAGGLAGDDKMLAAAQDSLITSIIASGIIVTSLKTAVGRARPMADKGVYYSKPFTDPNSSFPSGHSAQAFAVAAVLSEHYDETWQQATFYGVASLAALARPYHDKHFASDIVASAFISVWTAKRVVSMNRELRQREVMLLPSLTPDGAALNLVWRF
ncbi:MAG: phosphatase PAP2 family protein [Gammaproteobacteria bacterium]|nr:phosphatase PAP2 family protein [Gammaproteobacteria bacterium]